MRRRDLNVKSGFKGRVLVDRDGVYIVIGSFEHGNEHSDSINVGKFYI